VINNKASKNIAIEFSPFLWYIRGQNSTLQW